MTFVICICVFVTVAALAFAFIGGQERPDLERRVSPSRSRMDNYGPVQDAHSQSGLPAAILGLVQRFLPSTMLDGVQTMLEQAGYPISLQKMVTVWVIGIVGIPAVYAGIVLSRGTDLRLPQIVSLAIVPVLGFYVPKVWLSGKIKKRRKSILRTLPDGMDLITTSVEAGLGIDAALARVADKVKGPLGEEFSRCLREMSLGRTRREALLDFAARVQIDDINSFVTAVVQAEQMGVSLGNVMRIQSDQLRTKRKQRAEQEAQKAPVKMVIPLVLFIFPAMFIVILGPAAIQIFNNR
jgi:tight adherence protein C